MCKCNESSANFFAYSSTFSGCSLNNLENDFFVSILSNEKYDFHTARHRKRRKMAPTQVLKVESVPFLAVFGSELPSPGIQDRFNFRKLQVDDSSDLFGCRPGFLFQDSRQRQPLRGGQTDNSILSI